MYIHTYIHIYICIYVHICISSGPTAKPPTSMVSYIKTIPVFVLSWKTFVGNPFPFFLEWVDYGRITLINSQ